MSDLQNGLSAPDDLSRFDPDTQRSALAAIADAGIDHVLAADHVSFIFGSGIDGPVRLAALGAMEPRLVLHPGVVLLALRHPLVAARQIATLAE
jgi:alkanesulfonate monooxygenase SsuD/methylene tetrahydromethanopterin reductase-like flavin-dependent oxidoreductase (luciferase family)